MDDEVDGCRDCDGHVLYNDTESPGPVDEYQLSGDYSLMFRSQKVCRLTNLQGGRAVYYRLCIPRV